MRELAEVHRTPGGHGEALRVGHTTVLGNSDKPEEGVKVSFHNFSILINVVIDCQTYWAPQYCACRNPSR